MLSLWQMELLSKMERLEEIFDQTKRTTDQGIFSRFCNTSFLEEME